MASSERAQLQGVTLEDLPDGYRARVKLGRNIGPRLLQSFVGQASGQGTLADRPRFVALATLQAVQRAYQAPESALQLLGIKTVESFDRPGVIVAIQAQVGQHNQRLVGFCEVGEDAALAVAKAVLNGLNRFVQYALAPAAK